MAQFKSEAHRAKFAELLKQKKISQADFDSYTKATGAKKLPERIKPKGK
jgi:hypothetical protein